MGPDDDEAEEERGEIEEEITDLLFGHDDEVSYWDNDGKKRTVSEYSWGENGC